MSYINNHATLQMDEDTRNAIIVLLMMKNESKELMEYNVRCSSDVSMDQVLKTFDMPKLTKQWEKCKVLELTKDVLIEAKMFTEMITEAIETLRANCNKKNKALTRIIKIFDSTEQIFANLNKRGPEALMCIMLRRLGLPISSKTGENKQHLMNYVWRWRNEIKRAYNAYSSSSQFSTYRTWCEYFFITMNVFAIDALIDELHRSNRLLAEAAKNGVPSHSKDPSKLSIRKVSTNTVRSNSQLNPSLKSQPDQTHGLRGHADASELLIRDSHGPQLLACGSQPNDVGEVAVEISNGMSGPVDEVDGVVGLASRVEDPEPDVGLKPLELSGGDFPLHQSVEVDGLVLLDILPIEGGLELGAPAMDPCALSGSEPDEHERSAPPVLYPLRNPVPDYDCPIFLD